MDNGNGTATVTFNPGFEDSGVYIIDVTATDPGGLSSTESFTVTVNDVSVEEPGVGFMTGGGNYADGKGKNAQRYTWGFEVHCDGSQGNFQFDDHTQQGNFHLESITSVSCSDDPDIEPESPSAGFDTLTRVGEGRWNGASGAMAHYIIQSRLTDPVHNPPESTP